METSWVEENGQDSEEIAALSQQSKARFLPKKVVHMCGFQVPRNHVETMELDCVNGNSVWRDAEATELNQIDEHKSFIDKGIGFNPGSKFKKIKVHMLCAVKHDGRHKARFVAGGHLAETHIDSACSSVVSL